MSVYEMIEKVVKQFEAEGIAIKQYAVPASYSSTDEYATEVGQKRIYIDPVYRHNGAGQDVTAKITVTEITKVWLQGACNGKQLCDIRVPKGASDKVIKNRVAKAIAAYRG